MVKLRTAYEKRARPGGGRWGRVESLPLSLYYELDDMRAQIAGLNIAFGTNRKSILTLQKEQRDGEKFIAPSGAVVGATEFREYPESLYLPTFVTSTTESTTDANSVLYDFRIDSLSFITTLTVANITAFQPRLYVGGIQVLNDAVSTWSNNAGFGAVTRNRTEYKAEQGIFSFERGKIWNAGTPMVAGFSILAGSAGAVVSTSCYVGMTIFIPVSTSPSQGSSSLLGVQA